jgi:hypothetical protein
LRVKNGGAEIDRLAEGLKEAKLTGALHDAQEDRDTTNRVFGML